MFWLSKSSVNYKRTFCYLWILPENKWNNSIIVRQKKIITLFLEESSAWKKCFDFFGPLENLNFIPIAISKGNFQFPKEIFNFWSLYAGPSHITEGNRIQGPESTIINIIMYLVNFEGSISVQTVEPFHKWRKITIRQ